MKFQPASSTHNALLPPPSTRFGFNLFAQLRASAGKENVFISPFSIATALAMTAGGARGETLAAMLGTLELTGMHIEEVNDRYRQQLAALQNLGAQVELAIANSLWIDRSLPVLAEFVHACRTFYGAEATNLDFKNPEALITINDWVKTATKGKLERIIEQLCTATAMVLLNAIYFKGIWQDPFDPGQTRDGVFRLPDGESRRLPMMHQEGQYSYLEGEGFQAIRLPYAQDRIGMYVFLPNRERSLQDFIAKLSPGQWQSWLRQFWKRSGRVALPRFNLNYSKKLKDPLRALGMAMAFGGGDFSGMSQASLVIAEVYHRTFLQVNEEGSEAAAATAVVMVRGGSPEPAFNFEVDRPFFCAIVDSQTDDVLFMGSVQNPELQPT